MIKAVFFDLYHTLVCYEPPREKLMAKALQDSGIDVDPEALRRPLANADEFIYTEIARCPLSKRTKEDAMALFMQHQRVLLREAGVEADEKVISDVLGKMRMADMKFVPFDDVIPALTDLKNRGLTLGLISNVEKDINPLLSELGISPLLEVVVTSLDAGFSKPQSEIFRKALKLAGMQASETIYVGDQYQVDIVGANKAGMRGVLIDRGGYMENVVSCPRVRSLCQIAEHL